MATGTEELTNTTPTGVRRARPAVVALAVLVSILLVSEVAARVVARDLPADWGLERISDKAAQIEDIATAEVVFLGDSTMEVGVDPARFVAGQAAYGSAYNAGIQAGSPRLWDMWAREFVLPELEPELVVIGVNSLAFNDGGTLRQRVIDRYRTSEGRNEWLGRNPASPSEMLAIYHHRAELRHPATWFGWSSQALTDGGHDVTTANQAYSLPSAYVNRMTTSVLNDYRIGGGELVSLETMVGSLRADGTRVALIVMPVVEADHVPMHEGGASAYSEYLDVVESLESRLGVPVIAPPQGLFTEAHFADPIHLNRSGTIALTDWLSAAIRDV